MAGIGVGRHHTRIHRSPSSETAKKTTFIWNVGAGAQAKVNDNVSADLGYRYVYVGKLGRSNICPGKIRLKHPGIHEFVIGVVYNFDNKAKSKDNSNFVLANIGGFTQ
jgi:opacity protein-like surface antigen